MMSNAVNKISLVFFYLTLILGVPGNAFVVYVAGLKMKRTVTTAGFLNLAIADLLCCLSTLLHITNRAIGNWPFGSVMCKIFPFFMYITMFASVFTLSFISLDRFTLVITPVWAQNHRSLFIARLSCATAWILASILCVPFMFTNTFTFDNKTYCMYVGRIDLHRSFSIIRFVFGFLVPLICITTCYGFIAHKLGRSQFHSGRAFRIMSAVIVAFFLCWLPYHIVVLLKIYGEKSSSSVAWAVFPLTFSLAYFNSCLNPILYVFMGQDFKSNVKLSLRRVFERVFSEEGTQASQSTQPQHTHSV
ncbi:C3a anaphylatoxin chemotactic receptor-like [Carassius auratus]|uniref:C3a anaphylatoxin chemotactic receptor-like n=1 Tax=Carassius auratus TaxID=7957 RepID=A0A6P6Q8X3_CARAU|nr:C3a anaphylatoxin chemotactic receptor-like [Carassius auratus]